MSQEARAIRSVCVAGAGIVGLSAALAFSRALPGVEVTILATPDDPSALTERQPASLPTIHRFHRAIGFDEAALVRDGVASHLLGTRFEGWCADGASWVHAFGPHGLPAGDVAFHQLWLQARERPFHAYSAAALLAEAGKFSHPAADPDSPFGTFLYGLRLDPRRYRERLETATRHLPKVAGAIEDVERAENGHLSALLIGEGRRIAADLFLDCTGPGAGLIGRMGGEFEDWSRWLPCDRYRFGEAPASDVTACDRVEAGPDGWRWTSSWPDGGLVIEGRGGGSSEGGIAYRSGRRPEPWVGNVLALGEAAVCADPLHGGGLHLAHSAILRALELLPGRDCRPLELQEYVRRTEWETLRVRDFLALPYLRSGRAEQFWAEAARHEPPPTLARTLEQFERRGRLPFFEEESFEKDSWLALLLGLGVYPRHADPAVTGLDMARAIAAMRSFAARLEQGVAGVPLYRDLLPRLRQAAPRR